MFALAACQEELQQPVEEQKPVLDEGLDGELVEVTFSVDVTDAAQTKSISDGLSATNLQYAVYRFEDYVTADGTKYPAGQYIPSLSQGDDPNAVFSNAKIEKQGDRTWLVTLTLAKNVKYDIVFWAYADNAPYTFVEKDAKITVDDNYSGLANAENRDAFYGICREYSVISSETKVELRRPFAQINFGASDYIPYITDLGLEMTSTIDTKYHAAVEAIYENNDPEFGRLLYPARPSVASCTVPTILNVLTGDVDGGAEVNFATQKIPYETGDKVLLTTGEGAEAKTYHWMGMNYILAGTDRATIDNIHATFTYNGYDLVVDVPNVPYRRNYKTNILGNIFTGHAQFNVVIMPDYTDTYVRDLDEYSALNPIQKALFDAEAAGEANAAVTLTSDLALESVITVPQGFELSVDLGGKTVTSTVSPAFQVYGSVKFSNGNIVVTGEAIRAGEAAQVELVGVKVVSGSETAPGDNCVFVPKDASNVNVVVGQGTELKSYGTAAIQSNGHTQGLELTVAGKVESVGDVAIYLPQVETCTIKNTAEIFGATGIEIRAGELIVEGGKFDGGKSFSASSNGNGSTVNGAAIAVSTHSTNLPINVRIEAGTFSGRYSLYEVNFYDGTTPTTIAINSAICHGEVYSENCTGFVTSGRFYKGIEDKYIADGSVLVDSYNVVKPFANLTLTTTGNIPAAGGKVKVYINANVPYVLEFNGQQVDTGNNVFNHSVEVDVPANNTSEVVTHTLKLSSTYLAEPKIVTIKQEAA